MGQIGLCQSGKLRCSQMRTLTGRIIPLVLAAALGCSGGNSGTGPNPGAPAVPLEDLGMQEYLGMFEGGLYPGGVNTMPGAHNSAGQAHAGNIQPRDISGTPSPSGKYVLLSIGMSNVTQEWCAVGGNTCNPWTLMGKAATDPAVNHQTLVIANGAEGGQVATDWDDPNDPNYDRVLTNVLTPRGLSEKQVQAVWLKEADRRPSTGLPSPQADAYELETNLGNIVRALRVRYPNLQIVFLSSRIYAGYASSLLNPEPYAFESGFAVKWLVEAQITQMQSGTVDPRAGNLDYNTVAPWIAWGPYLWAAGGTPRSDGLTWVPADYESDGTHPSTSGETKVANLLLSFFKTDSHASCWFLAGSSCP